MKNAIYLSVILLFLVACKKDSKTSGESSNRITASLLNVTKPDTIPDNAAVKLKLVKDSLNYDETMLCFNHSSSSEYDSKIDAVYFTGFGQESLASLSRDGVALAINNQPYTPNMSIGLDLHVKNSGVYLIKISYQKDIPGDIHLWLKDNYRQDSIEVSHYNYYFDVYNTDTASFGKGRFQLIVRPGGA
jgi:hypothetical protein